MEPLVLLTALLWIAVRPGHEVGPCGFFERDREAHPHGLVSSVALRYVAPASRRAPAYTTTGLTHIGAREYDPSIGQFISVDPLLSLAEAALAESRKRRQQRT
ncbi:hypothetical protein ABZ611_15915 [Streptomyces sp. NPDC007861]|uniref:hypothetical protein n=1 Tax=Streptomyces sp. NPDC007861 TaxID=3154893 RepID=UPI003409D154